VSREEIEKKDPAQTGTPERGGTIRAGIIQPAGALDPITVADQGGLGVLGQSGEYLIWSDRDLKAQPRLAESWSPSEGGRVWRFKIRQGVTFHDGTPMDAEDVASTFNRLADPDTGSNALSVFSGVLSKDNAKAVDGTTVEFQLDAPNGNFPFLVSSDNYNAIILPKDYDGDWEKTFIGTGPWKRSEFRPGEGVSYAPNREYWDKDHPDRRRIRGPLLRDRAVRGLRAARQRGRHPRPVLRRGRQGAADRAGHPHDRAAGLGPPPGPSQQLDRAVQGQAHASGDGAARSSC